MRVVSLVPSATETLLALGVRPVACTRFCEQPGIPTVGGTKNPDLEAILAARPDVVVVNDEENRSEDAEALIGAGVTLHDMSPHNVTDVGSDVRELAAAVRVEVPEPFSVGSWDRFLADHPESASRRGTFVPVWRRPWMTLAADTYGASVLRRCGLDPVGGLGAGRYPETTLGAVAATHPEVALLPSEPYPFDDRHAAELRAALGPVDVRPVDGRDLFWWGSRTPAALDRVRAAVAKR